MGLKYADKLVLSDSVLHILKALFNGGKYTNLKSSVQKYFEQFLSCMSKSLEVGQM